MRKEVAGESRITVQRHGCCHWLAKGPRLTGNYTQCYNQRLREGLQEKVANLLVAMGAPMNLLTVPDP